MINKYVISDENDKGIRLDVFLEKNNTEFTRSHIKKQIDNGEVKVNNSVVKAGYKLKISDEVELQINPPKEVDLTPVDMNISIVYQDNDMAIINKSQGVVVHPAVGNWDNTLVNGLLYQLKDLSGINGEIRPGIVHRLDKDTSGLLVIAKNDKAHVDLSNQIKNKHAKRYYLALVNGVVKNSEGEIQTYISRDKKNRLKMASNNDGVGKIAITKYKVLKSYNNYTLVEFELMTGRTHQIRVHTTSILNRPIVGDRLYGNIEKDKRWKLDGQLLHAYKLELTQPTTKTNNSYEIPLPDYFQKVIAEIETNNL